MRRRIFLSAGAACLLATAGCSSHGSTAAKQGCDGSLNPSLTIVQQRGNLVLAGRICSGGRVTLQQRENGSWRRLGRTRANASGAFSSCVRLRQTSNRTVVLRAVGRRERAPTTVYISAKGGTGCKLHLLRQDLATDPNPTRLWGGILAVSPKRYRWVPHGGPDGGPFRRLTAKDGDLFHGDSERAELGNSDYLRRDGRLQTFYLYRAGTRRVTSFWMRLPRNFPINTDDWQVVMQMKETDPATNTDGTPIISLQATSGQWLLKQSLSTGPSHDTRILWRTPARVGVWTHIVVNATYSTDPAKGRIQMTIGDASSPVIHTYTMKTEVSPPGPGLHVGEPIPSHLRLGIYHDPPMPGTSVDFTRVQIFG
jgi:hypothetical protein